MLQMLADENLSGAILRGLTERRTTIDLVRVQDVGLRRQADSVVLAWAAENDRVVLTHDPIDNAGLGVRAADSRFENARSVRD